VESPAMGRRVFITVGEASGDLHASHLVRHLKQLDGEVAVDALGGPRLAEAGAVVHRDTVSRAAMGLAAVGRAAEVRRLLAWTREWYAGADRPDLQICCDSWSMNYHFAKLAKSFGVPVLYYIAPQTWASREGRVKKMRRVIDQLACILPFEESYFREWGVTATYVGHPLFDELPRPRPEGAVYDGSRPPVVGLLCGSRRSIARANVPRVVRVAERILDAFPGARFLVPTTEATDAVVRGLIARSARVSGVSEIDAGAIDRFVPRCDFCLTVSGTAALHVAAYRVPLAVVYHGNPVLWHAIGRWVVKARTYSLVHILSGREEQVAREFIPWYGPVEPVAEHVISLLRDPARLAKQRALLGEVIAPLDKPGASANAARLAIDLLSMPK
jgi:lipid-A-disaccharide synthase